MRYLFGLAVLLIFGFVAWLLPPAATPREPLLSGGFLSFIAGWMVFTIPLALTLGTLGGVWLLFCSGIAKIEKSKRQKLPKSISISYSPHVRSFPTQAALPAPQPIDVTPAAVDVPSFSQLLDRGLIAPDRPLILGYTPQGMLTGSWKDLYSAAVAGLSGSGKTTTLRFLASQSALHGARFAIIDPHGDTGDESLAATLAPLQSALLCEPANWEPSIIQTVRLVQSRLNARLRGDADRTPLIVAVDEFSTLARNERIADPLAELLESIAQQGRKVGVFALIAGQVWTASRTHGTPLRDSLASCYVHRLRRQQARLLLSTEEARQAEALEVGQALLLRTNGECSSVSVPHCTNADIERVGRMLTPVRTQFELTTNSNSRAFQSAEPLDPQAARIVELFRSGMDVAAIAREIDPLAQTGARLQQRSREVQQVLRRVVTHEYE